VSRQQLREGDHPADQPGQSANIICKTRLQNRQGGSGRVLERAKGIEPSYAAWEAAVLPLNYARKLILLNQALLALFASVFRLVHVANRVAPFRALGSPLIARSRAARQAALALDGRRC
jgi:hypothetical protein